LTLIRVIIKILEEYCVENIEKIREQFPITKNKVFLNHAGMSPLPKPVADAVRKYADEFANFGTTSKDWKGNAKSYFAKLIGATPEEIALIESTSVGLNIVANALHYPAGSKIVTTDLEFPSVVYPWLRRGLGVKVDYVKNVDWKILLADVEKAVDDKTVAVVVSHVEYVNGFRHDLKALSEIAHRHGAYLIVDAIQSAGAMQVNARRDDVDFLSTACYKWLLSPSGAGFLYVKKELVEEFEPPFVGWASVSEDVFETIDFWDIWNLKLSETASRFEIGSSSVLSFIGAMESLKMLLGLGIENVEDRILRLTDHLIESVKDLGMTLQTAEEKQNRSGIVNFKTNRPQELAKRLREKRIIVSPRTHGLRVSPHFYNTEEEIDELIDEIKRSEK